MTPHPGGAATFESRLADELDTVLAARHMSGATWPSPWGVAYRGVIVATGVPPRSILQGWLDLPVVAANRQVAAALSAAGIAPRRQCDPPLTSLPDPSLRLGAHHSAVVRCDDPGPPSGDLVAIGAFLLCWALDAPGAHLILGDPAAAGQAASLGCGSAPVGPPPTVVVCGGTGICPPPVVVDALAAGIPVVGWRTPALGDVVGDAALLVDPDSGVEGLAGAIAALLASPELAEEIGRRGPARIEQLAPAAGLRDLVGHLASLSGPVGPVGRA